MEPKASQNPLDTSDNEQFVVGESNLRFFRDFPRRCETGAILFCQSGQAEVTVNLYKSEMRGDMTVLLLPGSTLMLSNVSEDFVIAYCAFSRELFAEAGYRLDPLFFRFLLDNPVFDSNEKTIDITSPWMQMAAYTYADRDNIFRNTIIKNRLQNILLELYDKILRNKMYHASEGGGRRQELFHRFITLVQTHSAEQREVVFYADKLCISTRYLSSIVRDVVHSSPKEMIDRVSTLEIKMLLHSTDLSVQEIAYRLHFPDQSYLGRYFKKHTGETPTEYRSRL